MPVYKWSIVIISLSAVYFLYKSILILPAFVVGQKSLVESVHYSFTNITTLRVVKLFGGSIVLFIFQIIFQILIFSISYLFSFAPVLGPIFKFLISIIQLIILLMFSGFVTAFIIAAITGLYYRYNEVDKNTNLEEIEPSNEDDPPSEMINNLFA